MFDLRNEGPPSGACAGEPAEPALACRTHGAARLEALVKAEAARAPFAGLLRLRRLHVRAGGSPPKVVACVPVRDEADDLPQSLEALGNSLDAVQAPAAAVIVVNNSSDASAGIAARWAEGCAMASVVCSVSLAPRIADVGHARRFALQCGAALGARGAVLLSTDADTIVSLTWAGALEAAVRAGAAAAYGPLRTPEEMRGKAGPAARIARVESALGRVQARLWAQIAPGRVQSAGLLVGGANLAMCATRYRAVGGLPPLPVSEDRAMVRAMLRSRQAVVFAERARVTTSLRMTGRVRGGMADTLRARAGGEDLCDPALLPTRAFALTALAARLERPSSGEPACPRPEEEERLRLHEAEEELAIALSLSDALAVEAVGASQEPFASRLHFHLERLDA